MTPTQPPDGAAKRPVPRREIMDCIREVHSTQWHGMTYEEMLADGAEIIRQCFVKLHEGLIQENARAHESYEGLNSAYHQLSEQFAAHAATEREETVRLLESNLNFMRGYCDFVACQPMVMESVVADIESQMSRIQFHLTRLKEQTR